MHLRQPFYGMENRRKELTGKLKENFIDCALSELNLIYEILFELWLVIENTLYS